MVTTRCIRNAVSQVDLLVSRERREAPAARTRVESGAIFLSYLTWHYDNGQGIWPSLVR